jgi:signal peptidase I
MGNAERPAHRPLRAHIFVRLPDSPMRPPRTRKLASLALGAVVLACLWFYLAPVALGGSTTYVVTEGISMEPRFHTGDLAVVRSQSSYHVGEIVAYYSKAFHTVVLHRIIGRAGAHYVFKGDNNSFVDFEHPAASQLIGAVWMHIPGVGGTLESVRSPALIGGLAALGVLLLAGGVFTQRRRRRRRAGAPLAPVTAGRASLEPVGGVLALLAIGLVPFVMLAMLAFTRQSSKLVPFAVAYEQSGTLSYTAHAKPGPIYANNTAVTGDPLFTHVLSTADLRFAYEFHAPGPHVLTGEAALYAELSSSSGWRTTLRLGQPLHFQGDRAVITAPLPLTSLQALVHSVQVTTGVGGSYALTLLPRISTGGSVSTLPLHAKFAPVIRFSLTPLEAAPVAPASAGSVGANPSASQFTPSNGSSITGKHAEPLSLSFGVVRLRVATARAIAIGGIAIVILLIVGVLAFLRPQARDEAATIRSRYGRLIVPVEGVRPLPGVAVIDVADMDALVRIAEHYDRSILHESSTDGEAFWVADESGHFRYTIGGRAAARDRPVSAVPAAEFAHAQGTAGEDGTAEFAPPRSAAAEEAYAGASTMAQASVPAEAPTASFRVTSENGGGHGYTEPPERMPDDAYAAVVGAAPERTAETPYTFRARPEIPADEVYVDELEPGVIDYGLSRAGRPNRPNTSPTLPAWTGSSG